MPIDATRCADRARLTRRQLLGAGGLWLAGLGLPRRLLAADPVVIRMRSDARGARVFFDPIGLLVQPGARLRWVLESGVHTTTAYHPANDGHPLRIPEQAAPWDSGYLVEPEARFDVTLTVPGIYDYFCGPHEAAGMVGRIVVGEARGGPATRPFENGESEAVPPAARAAFPLIERILREGAVRAE